MAAMAAMAAKGGGFIAMRDDWAGTVSSGPGRSTHPALCRSLQRWCRSSRQANAYVAGAGVGALVTRAAGGFTPELFAAVGAVAAARRAGLP